MTFSLTEDFWTMEEFEKMPRAVMEQIRQTGRPGVITTKGKPDVVILDVKTYEKRLQARRVAQLLAEGEADIKAEGTRPIEGAEAELLHGKKPRLKGK